MRPATTTAPPRARGFTLIEVMLVVAILGIMATLVNSSMSGTISRMREDGSVKTVAALIGRARVTAMKQHARVEVSTATPGRIVLRSCPAKYGIPNVCVTSTSLTPVPQGELKLNNDEATRGVTLSYSASGGATSLVFDPGGFPESAETYTYTIDHASTSRVRKVTVTAAGEIRID